MNYLIYLEKDGKNKETLRNINWILTHLSKHADLDQPDTVDTYIRELPRSNSYKHRLTQTYGRFLTFCNIQYTRPSYPKQSKMVKVPTHEKIQMIISNSGRTMGTKLQLSMETGLRPCELHNLKVKDVDTTQNVIYPTTAKNGAPRMLKISNALTAMIQEHITRNHLNQNDQLFKGNPVSYGKEYRQVRNRLAEKLHDPTIKNVRLYDLRHYFATMLYHKTKDILFVKAQMGHKRIDTTLIYAQLLNLTETDDYTCKAANNIQEATQLIENGFEYITEMDGMKLFRKRK